MSVERFIDDQGRLFLKTFLIDTSKNDRGWAVTPEAIDIFAKSFIGKPVTLMRNKEDSLFKDYHPFSFNMNSTVSADIEFAEKYAIGHITDVVPSTPERLSAYSGGDPSYKSYDEIYEVEDHVVKAELIKEDTKLIPPEVSPGIVWFSGTRDAVEEFTGVHLAIVPKGAYGPRAKQIAKCNGAPIACRTELLRASSANDSSNTQTTSFLIPEQSMFPTYEERTGGCPLSAFSSLLNESASSDTIMSVSNFQHANSSPHGNVPGPRVTGTNTFRSPSGSVMATQNSTGTASGVNQAPATQQTKKLQLRLKDPKRFLVNKPIAQEEEEKNKLLQSATKPPILPVEKQSQTNPAVEPPVEIAKAEVKPEAVATPETGKLDPGVVKELEELRKTSAAQERRWHLSNLIPRELFVDSNKRFRQKDWQQAIDDAIGKNLPDDIIVELYQLKMKQLQFPEIQVQASKKSPSTSTGRLGASTSVGSSQDTAEIDNVVKCLQLMRGISN